MAMQIDETELEDMRDDALALAKGVLDLLEAAQAAAGTGVQLGEEGLGALVSEQKRVVSAIAGIAPPRGSCRSPDLKQHGRLALGVSRRADREKTE